jgi:PKD repeat protein
MKTYRIVSTLVALAIGLAPASAFAAGELEASVEVAVECDEATFRAALGSGTAPYTLQWTFGDSESLMQEGVSADPDPVLHTYPAAGEYTWSLSATDPEAGTGEGTGLVLIEGPMVSLTSDPFPPLLTLEGGAASADFTAEVEGGVPPHTYTWDLNGDGTPDPESAPGSASFSYTEAGKFQATVMVTDSCGLTGEDTLPVVVIDPEAEACHPMAQRIADSVNTLFPSQAETLYTCEDIFSIFDGALTGSQIGFGRLWHAYQLSLTMEELTWEEIRDWHLFGNGWGLLVQLDRFADTLAEVGLRDLVDRVLSGEASVGDIRHAVRATVRYDADFEDALARLAGGMSPGELGQLYRTAEQHGLSTRELDAALAGGATLQELNHASRLASRTDSDWSAVLADHAAGQSWGEINRSLRSAGEESASESGPGQSGDHNQHPQDGQDQSDASRDQKTAARLAKQFGVSEAEVWALFNGSCAGSWGCVRSSLRQSSQGH